MATLVFGVIGGLFGPIFGTLGALVGRQVDQALLGPARREGSRLKELSVTTSSYGMAIARHHGRVRAAGSMIWATDLVENSESTGYSYSVSFAVALSSRPILSVGRIWADGNLLRGEAGDLKVGGAMRLYRGHGDQPPDPLVASDIGEDCPAFRHTAYAVFEDLQLADFGNRIPALTFEIFADNGEVRLVDIVETLDEPPSAERTLPGLEGFSFEGGALSDALSALGQAWPLAFDAGASGLSLLPADELPDDPPLLPEPAAGKDDEFRQGVRHPQVAQGQ